MLIIVVRRTVSSRGNEEQEESLEADIPTVDELNQKIPMSRAEQDHEDCGHAVYRTWCVVCVKDRCVGKQHRIEPLEEEERERTTLMIDSF